MDLPADAKESPQARVDGENLGGLDEELHDWGGFELLSPRLEY